MGSPETVSVSHKANALCYNTVSLLPVRLIRAPVLKPRPRSRAGQPAGHLVIIWQTSSFRAVRRGRMHAARQRCAPRGVSGEIWPFTPVCRAGVNARPTIRNTHHINGKRPTPVSFHSPRPRIRRAKAAHTCAYCTMVARCALCNMAACAKNAAPYLTGGGALAYTGPMAKAPGSFLSGVFVCLWVRIPNHSQRGESCLASRTRPFFCPRADPASPARRQKKES